MVERGSSKTRKETRCMIHLHRWKDETEVKRMCVSHKMTRVLETILQKKTKAKWHHAGPNNHTIISQNIKLCDVIGWTLCM